MSLIGLILLLPAQARYVQVTTLEEITSGAQYLITTTSLLIDEAYPGYMMSSTLTGSSSSRKLASIKLPEEDVNKYVTWKIIVTNNSDSEILCALQQGGRTLGISQAGKTPLEYDSENISWKIEYSSESNGAFQIRNEMESDHFLNINLKGEWANFSSKAYRESNAVYLFKQISVPAPEFSSEALQFYDPIQVELTVADGYTIHYTTDGTIPTVNSTEYSGPIEISGATTTVKAIAVEADGTTSEVVEQTYTYCPPIVVNLGGEDHLGTLYSAYPVQLPANAAAWLITGKDDATATLQLQCYADEAGTVLPAEVPYLIQGTSNDEPLNFVLSTPPPVEKPDYADDLFKGTAERVTPPANVHILGLGYNKNETAFGFYPFVGEYIAANRAYLTLPKGATYRLITSMEDFVSGEQYILVTENNDGQPAGYYAGEFETNKLKAYPVTDEEPYLWTFTQKSEGVQIRDEEGYGIEYTDDTSIKQSQMTSPESWTIAFDNEGHCKLGNNERLLQYSGYYTYFKNYTIGYPDVTLPYLFLREEVDASSQAAGYALRLERPVGIGGARGAEAPGAGAVYDLRGRRLEGRPARGLYIEARAVRLAR